uniref:Uncharacterized protein n=1 Tax=Arundo donax TaxID=35708 RepID=A0A0A9ARS5_ARUDO
MRKVGSFPNKVEMVYIQALSYISLNFGIFTKQLPKLTGTKRTNGMPDKFIFSKL